MNNRSVFHSWFQLYPGSDRATRLSVAGGGVKLASLFLLAGAALATLALLVSAVQATAWAGFSPLFLLDELEDLILLPFLLWGAFAACRYAASVLQAKALLIHQMSSQGCPPSPQPTPED